MRKIIYGFILLAFTAGGFQTWTQIKIQDQNIRQEENKARIIVLEKNQALSNVRQERIETKQDMTLDIVKDIKRSIERRSR